MSARVTIYFVVALLVWSRVLRMPVIIVGVVMFSLIMLVREHMASDR